MLHAGVTHPLAGEGWRTALETVLLSLDPVPDARAGFLAIEDSTQREDRFRKIFGEWQSGEGGTETETDARDFLPDPERCATCGSPLCGHAGTQGSEESEREADYAIRHAHGFPAASLRDRG